MRLLCLCGSGPGPTPRAARAILRLPPAYLEICVEGSEVSSLAYRCVTHSCRPRLRLPPACGCGCGPADGGVPTGASSEGADEGGVGAGPAALLPLPLLLLLPIVLLLLLWPSRPLATSRDTVSGSTTAAHGTAFDERRTRLREAGTRYPST